MPLLCSGAVVDDHGNFPLWPLEHGGGKLGGLPLLNFPEISMWGRGPWGACVNIETLRAAALLPPPHPPPSEKLS